MVLCAVAAVVALTIAQLLELWGQRRLAVRAPWQPPALAVLVADREGSNPPMARPAESARLMGIVNDRAYFRAGPAVLSVQAGGQLPSGAQVAAVERESVRTSTGERILLFAAQPATGKAAGAQEVARATSPAAVECALSASDRAQAVYIDPAVATALINERATLSRIFTPEGNMVRARATGGLASMFAVADGDLLMRANGTPLTDAGAVISAIIERVARGGAVVIEGERHGRPRRWVVASTRCRS
ncbi:MAG: hypothetical protein NZ533_04915 [Casimicrobiaceae bacterium]|nr:hypothetical protein [Casimicrobiaceae bacterium]MCX8098367.1 hypothetical protein [Casimicrobiaceae bacterium]MDW8312517.1 hypothetical protein [Burkholderiales bacterium]